MTYNFNQKINEASKQYGLGSNDSFQFEKGPNKFRVLTVSEKPVASHYLGKGKKPINCIGEDEGCPFHGDNAPKNDKGEPAKPSIKYLSYILDRKDSKVRLLYMPYSVSKAIGDLQMSEDYAFTDLPMPYDITVNYDPDGSPAQMYSVIPSPKVTEVPTDFMDKVKAMKSVNDIRESILNKAKAEIAPVATISGTEIPIIDDKEPGDLPF